MYMELHLYSMLAYMYTVILPKAHNNNQHNHCKTCYHVHCTIKCNTDIIMYAPLSIYLHVFNVRECLTYCTETNVKDMHSLMLFSSLSLFLISLPLPLSLSHFLSPSLSLIICHLPPRASLPPSLLPEVDDKVRGEDTLHMPGVWSCSRHKTRQVVHLCNLHNIISLISCSNEIMTLGDCLPRSTNSPSCNTSPITSFSDKSAPFPDNLNWKLSGLRFPLPDFLPLVSAQRSSALDFKSLMQAEASLQGIAYVCPAAPLSQQTLTNTLILSRGDHERVQAELAQRAFVEARQVRKYT